MKPSYAGIAASAAIASSLVFAFQDKGNGTEPAGSQLTVAQIETELKAINVYTETVKDSDGGDVFKIKVDGVNAELFAVPSPTGSPLYWRISGGWELPVKPRPEDVNRFNSSSNQAFSYLDTAYDPFLVVDQNVAAGASTEMLRSVVETYRRAIPDFRAIVLRNRA